MCECVCARECACVCVCMCVHECACVSLHILCYSCCPAVGLWRSSVDLHDTLCARMLEEVAEGE